MILEEFAERITEEGNRKLAVNRSSSPQPVHVFYGGADLFSEDTPEKLGRLAVRSLSSFAPDLITFAKALWLKGADSLPDHPRAIQEVKRLLNEDPEQAEISYEGAAFIGDVFEKTLKKLNEYPVEDMRIDFEDGYGFRPDEEEDRDAIKASTALAGVVKRTVDGQPFAIRLPAFGFRIKSFAPETSRRAVRTLELFVRNLVEKSEGILPRGFVVALPKVETSREVELLSEMLLKLEQTLGLKTGSIRTEILIETPLAIKNIDAIAAAGGKRLRGAQFGAYDYTSLLGIASDRQHLHHEACVFARSHILNAFAGTGVWLSDSVTTRMPVPIHKGERLEGWQVRENVRSVHEAWRLHFNNITRSMNSGFYQSWDLHPAQLLARYAAVYSFYLESADSQIKRLRGFVERATKATMTGNEFDDAASAEGILNFLRRGCASGALNTARTATSVGLSADALMSLSFSEIAGEKGASAGSD
ncbi:MAG: phosphoenolpyruvate kinase [Acidobacteria bacterium]|nr:MAG: phosphoenolpyruvate kinase [Acidobacteriota bacterium]REK02242.1 MAG: phosphoenolpyruvate kinase [Acidobacteriota bacterium]REK13955.1 MAG: phosphoenolpyruvate kinase [Acidobacteriota bacterium]REK41949.1 MAG: phosphoenolpyruvate kinase [Acidobacteriota bacterium]